MTTPGFRTVYIGATDEPGIHPPCQIGHPDRQTGGTDFAARVNFPIWTKQQTEDLVRLWNIGKSYPRIAQYFSERGARRTEAMVRKQLATVKEQGIFLRTPRKFPKKRT